MDGKLMADFLSEFQGWLTATVVAMMPMLWALTMIMNVGRPYFIRQLKRCNVRFGADVWWLGSVLVRDAIMILTLAATFLVIMPHPASIAEGKPLSVPVFAPLAAVFLFIALAIKLTTDCDDDPAQFRRMLSFLSIGAALYVLPTIFGIEAGSQVWMAPVVHFLSSRGDPGVFNVVSTVSVISYVGTAGYLTMRVLQGVMQEKAGGPRKVVEAPEPREAAGGN